MLKKYCHRKKQNDRLLNIQFVQLATLTPWVEIYAQMPWLNIAVHLRLLLCCFILVNQIFWLLSPGDKTDCPLVLEQPETEEQLQL